MTNQECKERLQVLMLIVIGLYFIFLVLKQVNAVAIVTISIIDMQKCLFSLLCQELMKQDT